MPGTVGHQLATVRIGWLAPLLMPLRHEYQFWSSALFQRAAAEGDTIRLCIRFADAFLMWRMFKALSAELAAPFCDIFARKLLLVLVHITCKLVAPEFYSASRWLLLVHFRVYTLLTGLAVFRIARMQAEQYERLDEVKKLFEGKVVPGNVLLQGFRIAIFHSGCFINLLPVLPPSVPFVMEAAVQLLALADSVANSLYTAGELALPHNDEATRALCSTMAHAFQPFGLLPLLRSPLTQPALSFMSTLGIRSASAGSTGSTAAATASSTGSTAPETGPCGSQTSWLLMLWFALFGILVLPLYITYCSERRRKLQYASQLLASPAATPAAPSHDPAPPSPRTAQHPASVVSEIHAIEGLLPYLVLAAPPPHQPGPPATVAEYLQRKLRRACVHLLCLWVFGAVCWHLVVALHPWLVQYMVVPNVSSLNLRWYWQLLCGSEEPCCRAR